jgi:hypothetical protein
MTLLTKFIVPTAALAMMFAIAPSGHSAEWNKKTILTVNETVEVPGATLTPGDYVVKLVDSDSNRHIVRFFNKDETEVLSTVIAIPNQRLQPTGDSTFTFYETPAGQAPALRAWFYPGDNFGQEFAYPERRAQELTQATSVEVPSVPDDTEPVVSERSEEPSRTTTAAAKPQEPVARTTPPAPVREPARAEQQEPTILAQAEPAPRPAPQRQQPTETETDTQPERLPDTASPAPLFGLIGLASFAAAIGLRRVARSRG